ncbi:MAG: toxin-antitoxin system YwqK family antitoxin [Bacteroidales bacterium]|nr:toxin-antitoxin system YwqK family antitoxin [Bacteroidales bacterium]
MKKTVLLIFILKVLVTTAQNDTNGVKIFYYPSGKKSSEGYLFKGQPDGYWKTYYETGIIKSEGNRKNFLLDSLWKFYDEKGNISLSLNYKDGKKNGFKTTYFENQKTEENYVNDKKNGVANYYKNQHLIKTINFIDGIENGISREFDESGNVITITEYSGGFIISQEEINRKDDKGLKTGKWQFYYDNGNIKIECFYLNDLKNGIYKEFAENGNLLKIEKYQNDSLLINVSEVAKTEIKKEYYANGQVKKMITYRYNIPEGISREYSEDGKVTDSKIYKDGKVIGVGIVPENGLKQGFWYEYYETGEKKGEGEYDMGKKSGIWKFYFKNGKTEQTGEYLRGGKPKGKWYWYYPSGNILREEIFEDGKAEGLMKEYNDSGKVIVEGNYSNGKKEGKWSYDIGDYIETGNYKEGLKFGEWKGTFKSNGTTAFTGNFVDGYPNGEHFYYYDNGKIMERGKFIMGKKDGEWVKYYEDGTIVIKITYENGVEIKYNGVRITPEFDKKDFQVIENKD